MGVRPRGGSRAARRGAAQRHIAMLSRWIRHPLVSSPVIALLAQLLLAGAVAAATGGGDFPRVR